MHQMTFGCAIGIVPPTLVPANMIRRRHPRDKRTHQYDSAVYVFVSGRSELGGILTYETYYTAKLEILTFDGQTLSRRGLYPHFPCLHIMVSRS